MNSDNFVVIQGFMCNELGLKGNDLLVFALIYGFCQDGVSSYCGGRRYIADTFNISLPTVDKALTNLISLGYITKESTNDYVHPDRYFIRGGKETLLGVAKKLYEGGKETLPKNIDKNITSSISTNVEMEKPVVSSPVHRTLVTDSDASIPVSILVNEEEPVKAKKKSRYEQCVDVINEKIAESNTALRNILKSYLAMRLSIKDKPMFVSGWKALISKLFELSQDANEQYAIVKQSLENSWATFYPLKKNNYKTNKQNQSVFSEYGKVHTGRNENEVIVDAKY